MNASDEACTLPRVCNLLETAQSRWVILFGGAFFRVGFRFFFLDRLPRSNARVASIDVIFPHLSWGAVDNTL